MISIFRRDLATHFWALAPTCAAALTLLALLAAERVWSGYPVLGAFGIFVTVGLGPLAWLLVNRLVVREIGSGAERVLEHLPLSRSRVLASKVSTAALLLGGLLLLGLSLLLTFVSAFGRDVPEAQAVFVFERSVAFLSLLTCGLLASASAGRHRHLINVLACGGVLLAAQAGHDPLAWTPLDVSTQDFTAPHTWARVLPFVGAAALLGLAFGLTQARFTRPWRGPATRGDAAACGVAAAILAFAGSGAGAQQPAFELDGPLVRWEQPGVTVAVRRVEGDASAALARAVGADVMRLRDALSVAPPAVSIDLGPATFERATLHAQGILVRTGFDQEEFADERFREWLATHVFDRVSDGRLRRGGWRLIHDGYPRWSTLAAGGSAELEAQEELRVAWALRALAADGVGDDELLSRWPDVRRRVGSAVAGTLARRALRVIAEARGDAAVDGLARACLADRRALFAGLARNDAQLDALFREHTGLTREEVSRRLAALRQVLLERHGPMLATLPPLETQTVNPGPAGPDGLRALRFQAGPGPGRFALLHAAAALSTDGVPLTYEREEAPLGEAQVPTASRYAAGARVLFAFVRYVPQLGCDVVAGWREVRVP